MNTLNGVVLKVIETTLSDVRGSGGGSKNLFGSSGSVYIEPIRIETSHRLKRMVWVRTLRHGDVELDFSTIPVSVLEGHQVKIVSDDGCLLYVRNGNTRAEWIAPSLETEPRPIPAPIKWGSMDMLLRYIIGAPIGLFVMYLAACFVRFEIEDHVSRATAFFEGLFDSSLGALVVIFYALLSSFLGGCIAVRISRPKSGLWNKAGIDAANQAQVQHDARLRAFKIAIKDDQ